MGSHVDGGFSLHQLGGLQRFQKSQRLLQNTGVVEGSSVQIQPQRNEPVPASPGTLDQAALKANTVAGSKAEL